jgi:predicted RNase H-like HicB family nuclease
MASLHVINPVFVKSWTVARDNFDRYQHSYYNLPTMKKVVLNYKVIIDKEAYPNGEPVYNTYCPTLDIADYGDTIEKALESIKKAIKLRLEVLAEEGQEIPQENEESLITDVSIAPSRPVVAAL